MDPFLNPIQTFTLYFLKIYFNIIFQSASVSQVVSSFKILYAKSKTEFHDI
jgi:hypothetical protein